MRWHEQYLGKPWAHNPNPPDSFNCGELLRYIYRAHFGYDAPVLLADTNMLRSCIEDVQRIERYHPGMCRVELPQDFDLAVLARVEAGYADHVGLFCGGDILHCRPKVGVFLDDAFTLAAFGWKHISYYRPEGLCPCMK